ncbi:MAG: bifunctional DNA-formamidopyrimidine glycosylase/DNA-(apurinic or apyrimidinic site) lyase [Planctomycetes bacterium]|nr:bifunctional DNA-formamidopyrimidine glycosylase/DNA-(apurinic or apyrimidinic site) lyase [Planctomycetota bacterium]
MPELPEVETIVRELAGELTGCTLGQVRLRRRDIVHGDPRPLGRLLTGKRVERVRRRAKRIILELEPATQLVFHLGMSGRLELWDAAAPIAKHTHLRIALRDTKLELRFCDPRRFGGVWCLTEGSKHHGRTLSELGPEPLELTLRRFAELLSRPRQIKALLLDQRAIAGLGNIYCDESLYAANVHPLIEAGRLDDDQVRRLLRAIKTTLRKAIRYKGTTFRAYRRSDGTPGAFLRHLRVYQRAGEPCRRCGTIIERLSAAGRSTFICPTCQPPP